ncbi:MAG TPA: phosphate ABC transporter substrate-binding protein PstS [Streptosporangiaceae bacterium]|nr:phosphate ABC transporter substrate-binding protein PstS [Streptosporangiaceae bacterium]
MVAVPVALVAACTSSPGPAVSSLPGSSQSGGSIPSSPAPGHATISETGSTLLFPLMGTWATAYHQQFPNISITTAGTGSGKGKAEASAGKVDIGASDAYLSSGELVQNPALVNVPLAISAQQVNYNLRLPANVHLKLDGQVLAAMYQGKITTWNDRAIAALNPGVALPATRVVPLHRSDSSGDTFLFTSYLSTHDPAWNTAIGYGTTVAWPNVSGALAEKGNKGMVAGCQATPGCVAYAGISYLSTALADGLGEAQLANTFGQYVLPTAATIQAAVQSFVSATPPNETISMVDGPASGGYPIVNYEYAIVSTRQRSAATARDIKAFLHWAITTGNGAGFLGQVRFEPLPKSVVSLSGAQITRIG